MKIFIYLFFILFLYGNPIFAKDPFIKIVTEEFPPYNYTVKGKLKGGSYEVILEVLRRLKIQHEFIVYPWVRTYKKALRNKNTLIFPIGRTSKREKKFKWVGEVGDSNNYLMKHKRITDISIKTLNEAKNYQTGTYIESLREQYLLSQGFELGKNLQQNITYEYNFLKLLLKRIDLWAVNEYVAYHILKKQGHDPQVLLEKAFFLKDISQRGVYLAFNKDTPDKLVNKFRKALREIKSEGIYTAIWKKYKN